MQYAYGENQQREVIELFLRFFLKLCWDKKSETNGDKSELVTCETSYRKLENYIIILLP